VNRNTLIAHDRLAMKEFRLEAARAGRHGTQIMTFESLVSRLAGGFITPIDTDTLRQTIQVVLPNTDLGELNTIKLLPGMVDAAANTLRKLWRSGLTLSEGSISHPRIKSILALEAATLSNLPSAMKRPVDLVSLAFSRVHLAPKLFGSIQIVGITELSPCWRPILDALSKVCQVDWVAGPRSVPGWLSQTRVSVITAAPATPTIDVVSTANAYHESVEALRWAREIIATGKAEPGEIAIAAATPAEYDDHFLALRSDANFNLHFGHGVKVSTTRDGQAAAALADIVLRGLSQTRMRRLSAIIAKDSSAFKLMPDGWTKVLPNDAPLSNLKAWERLVASLGAEAWPDGIDHGSTLLGIISMLEGGLEHAKEIGEAFLYGQSLSIWRKALISGAAASLDSTLETLRVDDGLEGCASVTWMPAASLAASPRKFVRLLGLTSSRWPRAMSEDRLLSDHIIPSSQLDPLPAGTADARDFQTILSTTSGQVVLSRPRRDSEGRILGRSVLLHGHPEGAYLARNRIPEHAMSETDRLIARRVEFAGDTQLRSAMTGWNNWANSTALTPHDGIVRPDHPMIAFVLNRTQSASSLRRLLREPLGFLLRYGMGLKAPKSGHDPLILDSSSFGNLVHDTLEQAVNELEAAGGLANQSAEAITACIERVAADVAGQWEGHTAIPPTVIWKRTLETTKELSANALSLKGANLRDQKSYSEVPFGGQHHDADGKAFPWDPERPVVIPGTGFSIAGFIDRLDLAGDLSAAGVKDYKSGKTPSASITLNGGKELQRCLYGFAVRALLGNDIKIDASLLYLFDMTELYLADADKALEDLSTYLKTARENLLAGRALIGPDSAADYDDMLFAMPAMASKAYVKRKMPLAEVALGDTTLVWDAE